MRAALARSYRPAGQAAATAAVATPTAAIAPAPSANAAPAIGVAPDGSIAGIDGMLNQVAGALVRQATPVVQSTILPQLMANTQLQANLGAAAGRAAAETLRPWVILGTVSLAALAVSSVVQASRPARRASRSRSR